MTAEPSQAVLDHSDDGRGAVPHDDGAALSTIENGEAVALPSVGGLMRGLAFTLAQAPGCYVHDRVPPAGRASGDHAVRSAGGRP